MEDISIKLDNEVIIGHDITHEYKIEEEYISEVKKEDIEEIMEKNEKDCEMDLIELECYKQDINNTGVKELGINWVKENVLKTNITYTKPGSLSFLLHGSRPSEQSVSIKMGRFGEFISKKLIQCNSNLELLTCGIQQINNKRKDVDLIFKDVVKKIIYYRELKGNIELDTEKIPATVVKCNEITGYLRSTYPEYTVDCAVLNWSVYNRSILTAGLSNIRSFETSGIQIEHIESFLKIVGIEWHEEDYYKYFREIGSMIVSNNSL